MKALVDNNGNLIGIYDENDPNIPTGTLINTLPEDASQVWDSVNQVWSAPKKIKIYNLVREESSEKDYRDIDYKTELTINLYPKRSFTFGQLDRVEWYSDETLTDLILTVDIVYNRDALGFAIDRTTTRTWYYDDNTPVPETKITKKIYTINPQDQLDEIIRMRDNNVKQINIFLIGMLPTLTSNDPNITDMTSQDAINSGRAFFAKYRSEKLGYIDEGSLDLENVVRYETDPQFTWMDTDATLLGIPNVNTVRQYIIFNLSKGVRTT